jgi:hypothetical protein
VPTPFLNPKPFFKICGVFWTKFETILNKIQKKKSKQWARQGETIFLGFRIRPAETDSRPQKGVWGMNAGGSEFLLAGLGRKIEN